MTPVHPAFILVQQASSAARGAAQSEAQLLQYADGGVIMYPLTFCALMVLFLSIRAGWRIWGGALRDGQSPGDRGATEAARIQLDGILFWGAYAVVVGVLGTVVGFAVTAQSIEVAGDVPVGIVFGGLQVALIPTVWGLLYFLGAALIWFGLRWVQRKWVLRGAAL